MKQKNETESQRSKSYTKNYAAALTRQFLA